MRFAYADPPYIGQARKHYGSDAAEVDHAALIPRLVRNYPDGWALSCSSSSLRQLLPLCPERARVLAWVKPFAVYKVGVNPAYAWEPVIVCGGRPFQREQPTVKDWVSANIVLNKGAFAGAKPEAFCRWLFGVLNAQLGDQLDDLFPGTGAVGRAWRDYQADLAAGGFALRPVEAPLPFEEIHGAKGA
jgi:hypothetical protein